MAVEDFAYFSQTAPGFFFLPDTQKPGATSGIKHELPNFQANDSAIPIGMRAMTEVLLKHLAPPEETSRHYSPLLRHALKPVKAQALESGTSTMVWLWARSWESLL